MNGMTKQLSDHTASEVSTKSSPPQSVTTTTHVYSPTYTTGNPGNSLLNQFTPQNVSYFKKYANYMNRNAVKPLGANELCSKVIIQQSNLLVWLITQQLKGN